MNVARQIIDLPKILYFPLLGHWHGEGARLFVYIDKPKPIAPKAL